MDEKNVSSTETTKKIFTIPYILKGEFFEILKQEGESVTVQCVKCPQKNVYRGSVKSTGNFHMHIKRKHPESLDRLQELKLKSFMERKIKFPAQLKNAFMKTKINKLKKKVIPVTNLTNQNIFEEEPINCSKKAKVIKDEQIFVSSKSINIQNNLQIKSDMIKTENLAIANNLVKSELGYKENGAQGNSNNIYPINQNTSNIQSMTSSTPSTSDQNYFFHTNSSINKNINNTNNPMEATLTAASMMLAPSHDLLSKIDGHLKSIERQLHLRNQIETNRIYLDLAKFKYLHPNFAFQG